MPLLSKHHDPVELGDRLREAHATTAELMSDIITRRANGFPSVGQARKTRRLND